MNSRPEPIVFTRKASGLVKGLTWWDVFILVIAAPAGSGILYYSVSTASAYPGGNVAVAFLIGMVLVFPVVFIAAAAAGMVPRSGSLYVLVSRVVNPGVGFVAAGLFFVGYTLSIGVVAFIVTQVIGGILINGAIAGGMEGLQRFGEMLQVPRNAAFGGVVLVVGTWLLVLGGIQVFRRAMRWLFGITAVAVVVTIVYFFLVPTLGGAPALFDSVWGAGTYEGVLNLAAQEGWRQPAFSWEATFGLLLVVLFSYGGLELISYASGEVAHVARKPFVGYLSGWTTLAGVYVLIALSVMVAFGGFLGAYDHLFQNNPEALGELMPAVSPSVPFYIASVISNPVIGIVLGLGLTLWLVTTMVPYFFAPSRLIFALAMDRAIPPSLADVSERTGAPTKASHLTLVFALAGVFLNWAGVTVVLGTILFCALFVYWLYGLSALLVPFRRPDIYEASPIQGEFAGFPVLSWVGLFAFGVGWFVIFVAIGQLSNQVFIALAVLLVCVLLVYGLRLKVNQREGVDLDRIYDQLPPA